jgi:four helix bundle protein
LISLKNWKSVKNILLLTNIKIKYSIGANIRESQNAESKLDFIHKLKIAAKEADYPEYCLLLCEKSPNYPASKDLLASIIIIKKLLNSIISTMKNKVK